MQATKTVTEIESVQAQLNRELKNYSGIESVTIETVETTGKGFTVVLKCNKHFMINSSCLDYFYKLVYNMGYTIPIWDFYPCDYIQSDNHQLWFFIQPLGEL